ncbi:MAG: hypothetical protein JXJ19_05250 [Elusimicrobia bacterium]|nr:hypothetical protein [Elusimicrobiota bacterium]
MKKQVLYSLLAALVIIIFSAAGGLCFGRWIIGSYGGLVLPLESDNEVRLGRGVELGREIDEEVDAGIYIYTSNIKERVLGSRVKNADTFILLCINSDIMEIKDGILYAGCKIGIVDRRLWDLEAAEGNTSGSSAFAYGLEGGYEYYISPYMSLSAGLKYLYAAKTTSDVGGSNTTYIITYDPSNYINVFARFRLYL